MFNNLFKENWINIINFNSKVNLVEKPEDLKEILRIPLTPIKIEGYLLYNLFELLYPKFIIDQQNILDVVISDFDIENKVLGLYLYKTKKAGICESIEELPKKSVVIQEKHLKDINQLFNNLQTYIAEKKELKISSIRILKKRAVDLINTYCDGLEKYSYSEFLKKLLDLIQKLFEENLIHLHPEPNIFKFLKTTFQISNNIKLSKFFELLDKFIPLFNSVVHIKSKKFNIISNIQKTKTESKKVDYYFDCKSFNDFGELDSKGQMKLLQQKFNTETVLQIDLNLLLSFFLDLVDLEIPVRKEDLKLIFQKFLFGIRSYEIHWDSIPRPKLYNTLLRFVIRLFGINANLKKLSHWAIPELIFNLIDTYMGLNTNIVILLTDQNRILNKTSLLLLIENSSLIKIKQIENSKYIINEKIDSLISMYFNLLEKFGHTSIIKIDISLIQTLLDVFVFKFHKSKPFSFLKIIKMIRKSVYFQIYPEIPPFKMLKKKRAISLLKMILAIAIDKHEF